MKVSGLLEAPQFGAGTVIIESYWQVTGIEPAQYTPLRFDTKDLAFEFAISRWEKFYAAPRLPRIYPALEYVWVLAQADVGRATIVAQRVEYESIEELREGLSLYRGTHPLQQGAQS